MNYNRNLKLEYLAYNRNGEIELTGVINNNTHIIEAHKIKADLSRLNEKELLEFLEKQEIDFIEVSSLGAVKPFLIDRLIEETNIKDRDYFIDVIDNFAFEYFSRKICWIDRCFK